MWGLGVHFVLAVGFWVGDGRSGTRAQGARGQPAQPHRSSSWFRGRPRASRRGAHARLPVALHRSMSRERDPLPSYMTKTVESHGAPPLLEAEAPNPLPSSMSTTVESRKGSKPQARQSGAVLVPSRPGQCRFRKYPHQGGVSGRVSIRGSLPVMSRWTIHRLETREGARDP